MSSVRQYSIFISSTFKDMDAERDLVVNVLKPRLEQRLQDSNVPASVEIIDLRWGVNTQDIPEEERESRVLGECLDNIRSSKPFFIGFLGGRYGWIPSQERWDAVLERLTPQERESMEDSALEARSVTELEILFGVLQDRKCMPNSFFFMRRPEVYSLLPDDRKSLYCDPDPESQRRLHALKQKVADAYGRAGLMGNIAEYDSLWNGDRMVLPESLLDNAIDTIARSIIFMEDQDEASVTLLDSLIENDRRLAAQRNACFSGRDAELAAVMEHLQTSQTPLVILAGDGAGKTSIAAQLYARLSSDERYLPLVHFAEYRGPQSYVEVMLKKWLWQLDEAVSLRRPMQMEAHPSMLFHWLRTAACGCSRKPVLIIDNMQYLNGLQYILDFEEVGRHYAVVITSDRPFTHLVDGKNATYMALPPMNPNGALVMMERYMSVCHKSLPQKVAKAIAAKQTAEGVPATAHPLWTALMLNQLVGLDRDDFAMLRELDADDDAEKITCYLCSKVQEAPADTGSYLAHIIGCAESGGNKELVRTILRLATKNGVSYNNVCDALGGRVDHMAYLNILHELEPTLRVADPSGQHIAVYPALMGAHLPDTIDIRPIRQEDWTEFVCSTSQQLLRLYSLYSSSGQTQIAQTFYDEAVQNLACFKEEFADSLIKESRQHVMPWEEDLSAMQQQAPSVAFRVAWDQWRQHPCWGTKLLVQLAYLRWSSYMEYELDRVLDGSPDALPVETVMSRLGQLGQAYAGMAALHPRNLMSYLADYLYCASMVRAAKNITGSHNDARRYAAHKEKAAMMMYIIGPHSHSAMQQYADTLDENILMSPQTAVQKIEKSLQIYADIFQASPTEENLQNYFGSAAQSIQVLNMAGRHDEALAVYRFLLGLADQYLGYDIARVMGMASDYAAIAYFAIGGHEQAKACIDNAYSCFLQDLERHPDSLETIHSLAEIVKRRIDFLMRHNTLSSKDIDELEHWASKPLAAFPNDFKSHHMMMEAGLYRLCLYAYTDKADQVPRLAREVFQQITAVMSGGLRHTMLSLSQIETAASGLKAGGHLSELEEFLQLVVQLRNTLIEARLIPVDLFDRFLSLYR